MSTTDQDHPPIAEEPVVAAVTEEPIATTPVPESSPTPENAPKTTETIPEPVRLAPFEPPTDGATVEVDVEDVTLEERKPVIVISSASTTIGFQTIHQLSSQFSEKVEYVAGLKDTSRSDPRLAHLAVPVVQLDPLGDPDDLTLALKGVDRLLIIPPTLPNKTTPVQNLLSAALRAQVGHVVLLSHLAVGAPETAVGQSYLELETLVQTALIPFTIVRTHSLMENLFVFGNSIKIGRKIVGPVSPDKRFADVAAVDVANCLASILVNPCIHSNTTYSITGPDAISYSELAMLFSTSLNVPIKYEQTTFEEAEAAMIKMGYPDWLARSNMELERMIEQEQVLHVVTDDYQRLMGVKGLTHAEWVQANLTAFGVPRAHQPESISVLVTGALGNVGYATVEKLFTRFSLVTLFAGVSDKEKADKLEQMRINIRELDFARPETFSDALKGINRVFIIPPQTEDRLQTTIRFVDAAKAAGVSYVVLLSVILADKHDTWIGKQYSQIENHIRVSGMGYTILRSQMFMENNFGFASTIRTQHAIFAPCRPDSKFCPISVGDIALAAASVLGDVSGHQEKVYVLTGPEAVSFTDLAAIFKKELKMKVEYKMIPWEQAQYTMEGMGFPKWQIDSSLDMYRNMDMDNGIMSRLTGDLELITGHKGKTNSEWIAGVSNAFADVVPVASEYAAAREAGAGESAPMLATSQKVAIFGANGSTGKLLIRCCIMNGFSVVACVRDPATHKMPSDPRIVVEKVDIMEPATLDNAVRGCDAVIIAVGVRGIGETNVMSVGTKNIIEAMKRHGVMRVLAITSAAVVQDEDEGCCFRVCGRPLLKHVIADHIRMEEYLRRCEVSWTIVRAPRLTNGATRQQFKEAVEVGGIPNTTKRISRGDLAWFISKNVTESTYSRKVVYISD